MVLKLDFIKVSRDILIHNCKKKVFMGLIKMCDFEAKEMTGVVFYFYITL